MRRTGKITVQLRAAQADERRSISQPPFYPLRLQSLNQAASSKTAHTGKRLITHPSLDPHCSVTGALSAHHYDTNSGHPRRRARRAPEGQKRRLERFLFHRNIFCWGLRVPKKEEARWDEAGRENNCTRILVARVTPKQWSKFSVKASCRNKLLSPLAGSIRLDSVPFAP